LNERVGSFEALSLAAPPAPLPINGVSVVMVVYMTGSVLRDSITLVLSDPLVGEFVIVDNGSPPKVAAKLRALGRRDARVRLVQGHGNIGFARGANLGAQVARGRSLVFLNPDALLTPNCIQSLIDSACGQPSPCVVGACVLNPDGSEQRGGRRGEVTPVTTLMSLTHLALNIRGLRRFEIHREDEPRPASPIPVETISGACFYTTRNDFDALGGFDDGFFLHVEDIDFCWRARQQGGTVLFDPGARVVHLGSTSQTHPMVVEFHKGRGLVRYFIKRADNPWRLALAWGLSPLIMLAAVARPLLRRVSGRQKSASAESGDGWKDARTGQGGRRGLAELLADPAARLDEPVQVKTRLDPGPVQHVD
jgi:N-acetylglucosaminyl-diphospho-decaprenol L-rhamnosyltransferase